MSKKTEKIELRISPEAKTQLTALSRERGRSVSELIRSMVDAELAGLRRNSLTEGDGSMTEKTRDAGPDRVEKPSNNNRFMRFRAAAVAGVGAVALALGWSLAAQTSAVAQTEARVIFAEFDRDENGVVTVEEFQAQRAREEAWEADEDAEVDPVERVCREDFTRLEALWADAEEDDEADHDHAAVEREAADHEEEGDDFFAEFDGNGDRVIDFDEARRVFIADREEEFDGLDVDFNGVLTREEHAEAFVDHWLEEVAAATISADCRTAVEAALDETDAEEADIERRMAFAALDEDRDGEISREEFVYH